MTTCCALRYTAACQRPRQVVMGPHDLTVLFASPDRSDAVVYMVRSEDMKTLAVPPLVGHLAPLRTKHHAKPLSHYLMGRVSVRQVEVPYRSPGQAERSVRAFLREAGKNGIPGIGLVIIPQAIYDALARRAEPSSASAKHDTAGADGELTYNQIVLRQTEDLAPVPERLRQTYLGSSILTEVVRRMILCVARHDHPVLIEGETGTGKEVVAREIHRLSVRGKAGLMMPVNCAGIPNELLESELFGHVKGAFTGALQPKVGMWQAAHGGPLFLDEIGDLTPRHQVKILRALEDGAFSRVGSTDRIRSDARIIAATHCDLTRMTHDGSFREDLYYRLFAVRIRTPPLRDHPEDIPELANHFWKKIRGVPTPPLRSDVTELLMGYRWPGNARELKALLIHVATLEPRDNPAPELVRAVSRERTHSPRLRADDR